MTRKSRGQPKVLVIDDSAPILAAIEREDLEERDEPVELAVTITDEGSGAERIQAVRFLAPLFHHRDD